MFLVECMVCVSSRSNSKIEVLNVYAPFESASGFSLWIQIHSSFYIQRTMSDYSASIMNEWKTKFTPTIVCIDIVWLVTSRMKVRVRLRKKIKYLFHNARRHFNFSVFSRLFFFSYSFARFAIEQTLHLDEDIAHLIHHSNPRKKGNLATRHVFLPYFFSFLWFIRLIYTFIYWSVGRAFNIIHKSC